MIHIPRRFILGLAGAQTLFTVFPFGLLLLIISYVGGTHPSKIQPEQMMTEVILAFSVAYVWSLVSVILWYRQRRPWLGQWIVYGLLILGSFLAWAVLSPFSEGLPFYATFVLLIFSLPMAILGPHFLNNFYAKHLVHGTKPAVASYIPAFVFFPLGALFFHGAVSLPDMIVAHRFEPYPTKDEMRLDTLSWFLRGYFSLLFAIVGAWGVNTFFLKTEIGKSYLIMGLLCFGLMVFTYWGSFWAFPALRFSEDVTAELNHFLMLSLGYLLPYSVWAWGGFGTEKSFSYENLQGVFAD